MSSHSCNYNYLLPDLIFPKDLEVSKLINFQNMQKRIGVENFAIKVIHN